MTIGKEIRYFGGRVIGEWDDLPFGTVVPLTTKGLDEVKVVDNNTLAHRRMVGGQIEERTLVGEEINASGLHIGPQNLREVLLGQATYIYWEPDHPDGSDMLPSPQVVLRFQTA